MAVGNRTFMSHLDIMIPPTLLAEREQCVARGEIGSFVAVDGRVVGLLILADLPRPELERLSRELKQAGIKETILLTGDGKVVAQRIGKLAQMDRVVANCLPEDKVNTIRTLVADHRQVLMVGDGINDAPALATASVGIAVGTGGLTAAASAADGVLALLGHAAPGPGRPAGTLGDACGPAGNLGGDGTLWDRHDLCRLRLHRTCGWGDPAGGHRCDCDPQCATGGTSSCSSLD